jgi:hypothetical protein
VAERGLAVAVTGMHRSGTSLVAQLLSLCGVFIGEPEELEPANEYNPEGHFEHLEFVRLNEEILAVLGGRWEIPPTGALLWQRFRLASFRERARDLAQRMAPRAPWGWKDPRTCLTLPLWLKVVPELRIVSVVRPADAVARSLEARAGATREFSLSLWAEYNTRLLRAAPRRRTIVTSYDAYFESPEHELERIVRFLGLPASSQTIAEASAAANPAHRHHRGGGGELPPDVARLERRLFALAAK